VAAVPTPGEKFNQQFEVLEVLGSGGVSTVLKAKQLDGDRLVALKVLHTVENDNNKFKERFLEAARTASKLRHSGVARILQSSESDTGMAYAVMELVEGTSLRKLLKTEERLPALRAIKIAAQTAEIMEAAQAEGILHRDLKTDNIIVLNEPQPDTVKIVDFAFAYLEEGDTFVRSGTLIGSPRYLSPEQGGGKAADQRSDIYSLTVCLYEMLTGDKPYSANTSALLLYKHLNDPIPQIQQGQIDRFLPAVNDVINKGMAKLPDERYQSMKELSAALASLGKDLEKVKPVEVVKKDGSAESAQKGPPVGAIAGVIFILLLIVLGTAIYLKPQQKKTEAEFGKYKSEHKKNTIAFLEDDVKRLERRNSSRGNDPEYLRNLATRLRDLSEAQRDSGELSGAEKSITQAISLYKNNSAGDPETLARLKGQLALIKVQAKDYKGAEDILAEAQAALPPAPVSSSGVSRKEACLIPARLELNIHLHRFDAAGRDLAAVFDFGHSISKDQPDAPPAVATAKTAWLLVSDLQLKDVQEKMAELAFIDLLMDRLLDTDKDVCKAPSEKARALSSEIPADTPGFKPVAERTQALLLKYEQLAHRKTTESEKK
jgi:serine/threonine protein kinase